MEVDEEEQRLEQVMVVKAMLSVVADVTRRFLAEGSCRVQVKTKMS